MTTGVNWGTLLISLLAAINETLVSSGAYHLSNAQLTSVDQVISTAVTLFGIVFHHGLGTSVINVQNSSNTVPQNKPPNTGSATGAK